MMEKIVAEREEYVRDDIEKVRVNFSVTCDLCGIVGVGLDKEQAQGLKLRHPLSGAHSAGGRGG